MYSEGPLWHCGRRQYEYVLFLSVTGTGTRSVEYAKANETRVAARHVARPWPRCPQSQAQFLGPAAGAGHRLELQWDTIRISIALITAAFTLNPLAVAAQ